MKKIALIEDDSDLYALLKYNLEKEGFTVVGSQTGRGAIELCRRERPDLIILDIMLPRLSGFEVCRRLRQAGIQTPILMLTARSQVVDKVVGLKTGADDYVTKPFDMMELLARIEALLRRAPARMARPAESYRFGSVHVDFRRAEVLRDGHPVNLSAREFALLRYLIEHRGTALSREELLEKVWGYEPGTTTRTVDVHIAWLRQKLEDNPRHPQFILTVRGLGYKFAG